MILNGDLTISSRYITAGPLISTDGSSSSVYTKFAWAGVVEVRYQASDVAALGTTVPATATTLSTSTAAIHASSVPSNTGDTGLSMGAKAGIGVGVSLGLLILLTIVVFIVLRRRRRQQDPTPRSEIGGAALYEKDGETAVGSGDRHHELSDGPAQSPRLYELSTSQQTPQIGHGQDMAPAVPAYELADTQASVAARQILAAARSSAPPQAVDAILASVTQPGWGEQPQNVVGEEGKGLATGHSLTESNKVATADVGSSSAAPTTNLAETRATSPAEQEVEDPELQQLIKDHQRVKAEKERLRQLDELERREAELERAIQQKLAKKSQ